MPEVPVEAIAAAEEALASQDFSVTVNENTGELQVGDESTDTAPDSPVIDNAEGDADAPA